MFFSRSVLLAAASAAVVAAECNNANAFTFNSAPNTKAGGTLDVTWKPTTDGPVTLILREGAASNLSKGKVIASSIDNSGSYTWKVPSDLVRNSDYALQIVSDANPETDCNYSSHFVIDSDITVSSSASPLSSVSLPAGSSGSMSMTGSSASMTGSSASMTGSSSMAQSTSMSGSASGSSTSMDAQIQSTGTSGNAAPHQTAFAGLIGFAALGALVL